MCAAFDRYELYLDGRLTLEGPMPGDLPRWIPVDSVRVPISDLGQSLLVEVLVYHSRLERIHYQGESRPGFWAQLSLDDCRYVTDSSWSATQLNGWKPDTPRMNHLLDRLEDVDLMDAKWRWREGGNRLELDDAIDWLPACVVDLPDPLGGAPWIRTRGFVDREIRPAQRCRRVGRSAMNPPALLETGEGSDAFVLDEEPMVGPVVDLPIDLSLGNGCVVDFGEAITGMPCLEIETPVALTIDLGWSERLDSMGLPVVYSKGTHYQSRFHIPDGRHLLKPFHWTGFRYLRISLWAQSEDLAMVRLSVSAIRRALRLPSVALPRQRGDRVAKIESLCRYTLEKTLPEYPADCPTREKAHYWIDGLFIGLALESVYGEKAFTDWYCEAFRRVPMYEGGLFSSVYPGNHRILVDTCLMPVIGWRYMKALRSDFVVDAQSWDNAMRINEWYTKHLGEDGLVELPCWNPDAPELVFLDHPGLPWHHFSHPALDRRNPSAALNLFYLAFLQSLQVVAVRKADVLEDVLSAQVDALSDAIRQTFWDGTVLRDSDTQAHPNAGVSWLTNSLGVVCGVLEAAEATNAMRSMVADYDGVCRCSPGTIFWFLQAMSLTKLHGETEQALSRLFQDMLDSGATATWETFNGEAEDSLCHPWLAAPVAMYLADPDGFACAPPVSTQRVSKTGVSG